jgi:hypothetical protein
LASLLRGHDKALLIIHGEFSDEKKDPAKVYNAVLFIVSHPGTFKQGSSILLLPTIQLASLLRGHDKALLKDRPHCNSRALFEGAWMRDNE